MQLNGSLLSNTITSVLIWHYRIINSWIVVGSVSCMHDNMLNSVPTKSWSGGAPGRSEAATRGGARCCCSAGARRRVGSARCCAALEWRWWESWLVVNS